VPSVERTFDVDTAPDVVLTYLMDFAHAEAWDPGTESCTRIDSGPIAVGSSWHNVSKVAGVSTELTYTLDRRADDQLVFVGVNDSATSTDTITVRPNGTGSRLTYHANIEMHGLSKLVAPAVKLVFEKLARDTVQQLTAVLNAL
jgi:carbon monoxide dehydrogenase subunit G